MTSDATNPAGDEARQARRPTDHEIGAMEEPHANGVRAASKFVGRVSQLDAEAIRAAIQAWHDVMRAETDAWFSAERAAGHAILVSGRTAEQEILLDRLAECVLRGVWYRDAHGQRPATPEDRVGATEASGQYVATVAMLAVLVRDHLAAAQFALLYRPFATLIPLQELERG
jgi:hypothetical protein